MKPRSRRYPLPCCTNRVRFNPEIEVKTMKPIIKLCFVALLIGATLSLPSKVRAASGQYTCSSQFPLCYQAAQQYLGQCTARCTEDGGDSGQTQVCYAIATLASFTDGQWIEDIDQFCDNVNYSGASCVQECVNVFMATYTPCLQTYCTQQ